jgi:protein gp37
VSTGIQWTDETWNPVVGCTKVSQGCKNCYAKTLHDQRHKAYLAGKKVAPQYAMPFEEVQLKPERLLDPIAWREPRRVFVNSVSDLFHEDIPDSYIDKVFAVMALAPAHTFQILTKRPERMRDYMLERWQPAIGQTVGDDRRSRVMAEVEAFVFEPPQRPFGAKRFWNAAGQLVARHQPWPLPNVWLGVSVENQQEAYNRIPPLVDTPTALRFLSCEPMLGPIDLTPWLFDHVEGTTMPDFSSLVHPSRGLGWVIVGGESGAKARVSFVECISEVVSQCVGAGVPVFVKQLGSRPAVKDLTNWRAPGKLLPDSSGYVLELHTKKGGDPSEWLSRLRVREWPAVAA